jgi:hypothetical protein
LDNASSSVCLSPERVEGSDRQRGKGFNLKAERLALDFNICAFFAAEVDAMRNWLAAVSATVDTPSVKTT